MLQITTYTGNVVQLRRDVLGINEDTSFNYGEFGTIESIETNIQQDKGIKVRFYNGKVLINKQAINYHSWLKRYFKLKI
jgi:hypothetical protein